MIVCTEDEVSFPRDRKSQHHDLMALAGDSLLRQDLVAWGVLYRAALALRDRPEFDSPEGMKQNAILADNLGEIERGQG